MAEIRPFRGLRYHPGQVGDLAKVIAPPFDAISPAEQRALHARSPHNVVRLEYGEAHADDSEHSNRYTRAAATLAQWLDSGVLVQDDRPAFYVYDQEFEHAGARYRRRALLTRVGLADWAKGAVRPHERTMAHPKEDRLRLLRACRANTSPLFALYRDPQGAVSNALQDAMSGRSPAAIAEAAKERHTLWPLSEEKVQRWLQQQFAPTTLYIADGHHRYETALAYRDERQTAAASWTGHEAENFVLAGLTAAEDPGLLILPIHRLVQLPQVDDGVLERLRQHVTVEEVAPAQTHGEYAPDRLLELVAERGRSASAFGLCWPGERFFLLTTDDPDGLVARFCPECPTQWRTLDVAVLEFALLKTIIGVDPKRIEEGGAVAITPDAHEACQGVQTGRYSAAFLLNPVPVDRVLTIADGGQRMPPKTTFFHPKLATGLAINRLDD
ncbi:MAG: DUF1015 domain-containing protein [Dehalococcoidia bacterium]|nr:MAG: DUF1015 domain-containing protein [Dehalococcoidia bacterium]